jgi:heme/copper-type cytochrome/quinol oxidase subunit 3
MTTRDAAPPSFEERNLTIGVRLLIAADVFVFISFLFAYVYLRALNSNGLWRPAHVDPSAALGGATVVLLAVAAVCGVVSSRNVRSGAGAVAPAAGALAAVVVAAVLQGIQTFNPGFSPSYGGGYGSVMVGFSACMLVHLLAAAYWSETLTATLLRSGGDVQLAASADGFGVFMVFLAVVMAGAFVLLYLV